MDQLLKKCNLQNVLTIHIGIYVNDKTEARTKLEKSHTSMQHIGL